VLDLQMPEMNGFEVLDRLKRHPGTQKIPEIVRSSLQLHLSATFVQSQDKAEGLKSGANGYLA
jgi:CheY-like chemotaxis protein